LTEDHPSQGRYLHTNTKLTQISIHALSGIRTHDPSVRAGEDISCLRAYGHCDWLIYDFHSLIHSSMALQSFVGPRPLLQLHARFYTDGRTPCASDQPAARPPRTHRTMQTQNKRIHRHPCPEWDSNPQFQRSSEGRQFMPQTARPP
jgi:hypothetical protein